MSSSRWTTSKFELQKDLLLSANESDGRMSPSITSTGYPTDSYTSEMVAKGDEGAGGRSIKIDRVGV